MKAEQPQTLSWWWTRSRFPTHCQRCRESIPAEGEIAFESVDRTILCGICADALGVSGDCRESRRYRKYRQSDEDVVVPMTASELLQLDVLASRAGLTRVEVAQTILRAALFPVGGAS